MARARILKVHEVEGAAPVDHKVIGEEVKVAKGVGALWTGAERTFESRERLVNRVEHGQARVPARLGERDPL